MGILEVNFKPILKVRQGPPRFWDLEKEAVSKVFYLKLTCSNQKKTSVVELY